jgi:glyceraldehyde 3-phosphate dehydrogenase
MIRVAINGYGRIGRIAHRVMISQFSDQIEVVAINAGSSTDITGWMYLLQYDSVYGTLPAKISSRKEESESSDIIGHLTINNAEIPVYSQKDPTKLPWGSLNVDVVIESTGAFTKTEDLQKHIDAGAKSVVLSAPYKDEEGGGPTYVLGVNLHRDAQAVEPIISNASCTTNCITPVAHIIHEKLGIEKAMMTTIHGYTSDQRIQDGGHKDYRRARAAAENIIPTSTGATKAAAAAIPDLKGVFNGLAIRVPVPVGSLADFTFLVKTETTTESVNDLLKAAAQEAKFKGIFTTTTDPVVSSDIIGNPHSSIADLSLTQVVGGTMVKVVAWYDNEFGYANRLVEETLLTGRLRSTA